MVKYRFFWQIFQQNKEQKEVNFLSAHPESMPLKSAILANTVLNSPVYVLFSSYLDHLLSQVAVLSLQTSIIYMTTNYNDPFFLNVTQHRQIPKNIGFLHKIQVFISFSAKLKVLKDFK